jgi:rhamnulokinase
MSQVSHHAAVDLGAESGRVILGRLEDGKISIEEMHRFPNRMREKDGGLRWDLRHLEHEILAGLKKIGDRQVPLDSVSCDSWGVDYVFLSEDGSPAKDPFCYRDGRNERAYPKVVQKVGRERIFQRTGLQFMPFNTLFQAAADGFECRPEMPKAKSILPIADYVNYFLGGRPAAEVSLASTTQFYDPRKREWARDLLEQVGFPTRLLPEIVPSGTPLGKISAATAHATGLPASCEVVASCSHDTGAAVVASPAEGKGWAYLSSGTWSLLGAETAEPVMTADCLRLEMTNEVGFGHTIRLLKNIAGLWLVQESRRDFARQGREMDYATLTKLAGEAKPLVTLLDPFLSTWNPPGEMTSRITAYARSTGQIAPASDGAFVRACLESLAMAYREVLESLAVLTGETFRTLHILGGGGQNHLLNQMAADATRCTVVAGPVEATAVGNLLVQAAALGRVQGLTGIRAVVRDSFPLETFQPKERGPWEEAWKRFRGLRQAQGKNP